MGVHPRAGGGLKGGGDAGGSAYPQGVAVTVAVSTRCYGYNIQGYHLFFLSQCCHLSSTSQSLVLLRQTTLSKRTDCLHRLFAPLRISRSSRFCQQSCISHTFCRLITGLALMIHDVAFGKIKPTPSGVGVDRSSIACVYKLCS